MSANSLTLERNELLANLNTIFSPDDSLLDLNMLDDTNDNDINNITDSLYRLDTLELLNNIQQSSNIANTTIMIDYMELENIS